MDFYLMARAYNSFGGHLTLGLIPPLFLRETQDFGPAIQELTLTYYFPSSGPPAPTLEGLFLKHHQDRKKLPRIVFQRAKKRVSIDWPSELVDGSELYKKPEPSLDLLTRGADEAMAALQLLRKRITSKDAFELEAFLSHCGKFKAFIPTTADSLGVFAEQCEAERAARIANMSPWERLGIDWDDYHPKARSILDEPFFWETSNDFSPNGNDTGADLLADFQLWNRKNPSGDGLAFFKQLIKEWGLPEEDELAYDEAAIALAFSEIKVRGICSPGAAALAKTSLERQRVQTTSAMDWSLRSERLNALEKLESKLP